MTAGTSWLFEVENGCDRKNAWSTKYDVLKIFDFQEDFVENLVVFMTHSVVTE